MEGKPVLPKCESEVSDSNIITPGTDFMYQLSKALRSYISARINNDPGWRNIKVWSICLLNIRYFIVEQHILLYSNAFCFGELEFTQIINTCLHILSFFNYFIARSNRLSFRMQMFLERENTKLCHLYAVSEMLSVIIQIPSTACMVWYENFTNSIYI